MSNVLACGCSSNNRANALVVVMPFSHWSYLSNTEWYTKYSLEEGFEGRQMGTNGNYLALDSRLSRESAYLAKKSACFDSN